MRHECDVLADGEEEQVDVLGRHLVGLEERLEVEGEKALAQCAAYARVLATAHHIVILDVVDGVGGQVFGYDPFEGGVLTQAEHHLLAVALEDLLDHEKAQPNARAVLLDELAHRVDQFVSLIDSKLDEAFDET